MYRNISGTSKSAKAMQFACSDKVPCSHIVLNNINLGRMNGTGRTAEAYCHSATGFGYGYVQPSAECLSSSDRDLLIKRHEEDQFAESSREHIAHTEL